MKKRLKEKALFDQLQKIPNLTIACEKIELSRNSVYRWCKEDPEFKSRLEEAINSGIDSISDLAESKLMSKINAGEIRAICYWLDNNDRKYIKPREKVPFFGSIIDDNQIGKIVVHIEKGDTKNESKEEN